MKGRVRLATILWLLGIASAHGEELTGKVVQVTAGDTVVVCSDSICHRVVISGIRAPENGKPFSDRSRQNLARMTLGKSATLQCRDIDREGRKVCKVWVQPADCPACGHTLDVGLAQISVGLALWLRQDAREQSPEDQGRYESEETEARLRKRGLWTSFRGVSAGCMSFSVTGGSCANAAAVTSAITTSR